MSHQNKNPDQPPEDDIPQSEALAAMNSKKARISGDVVAQATRDLPEDQRREIRWLHTLGHEKNLSLKELAALVHRPDGTPYSASSVYQALTGRRTASEVSLEPLCRAIARTRAAMEARSRCVAEAQATVARSPYVHTNLGKRLFNIFDAARTYQRPMFVFGEPQIGKTTAAEEYQRRSDPGSTTMVRMPTRGSLGEVLFWMARALHVSPQQKNSCFLKEKIIRCFGPERLLIIDEAHQPLVFSWGKGGAAAIDFLREIYDRSKCGIVLMATYAFDECMRAGDHAGMLRQMGLRRLLTYRMPSRPTRANLDQIASGYGLRPAGGPALEIQNRIIAEDGLGRWCSILQGGSRIANKAGQRFDWSHVIRAHAAICALESGREE